VTTVTTAPPADTRARPLRAVAAHSFRRSIAVVLSLVAVTGTAFLLLERYGVRRGWDDSSNGLAKVVDAAFVVVLVATAFVAGARPFTKDFKDRQSLFFLTLPLRRIAVWSALAGGSLAAGLVAAALVFALRPSLAVDLGLYGGVVVAAAWTLVLAAGACYALLVRSDLAAYLIGLFATGYAVWVGALIVLVFSRDPRAGGYAEQFDRPDLTSDPSYATSAVVLFVLLYLMLSYLFFARGEFQVGSVRWWRFGCLVVGHAVLVVVLVALQPALLATLPYVSIEEGWSREARWGVFDAGRQVFVVEHKARHPAFARLLATTIEGRPSWQLALDGLRAVTPTADGDHLLASQAGGLARRLGMFWMANDSLIEIDPAGRARVRAEFPAEAIEAVQCTPAGGAIVLSSDEERRTLWRLDPAPNGARKTALDSGLRSQLVPYVSWPSLVVHWPDERSNGGVWDLRDASRRLEWGAPASDLGRPVAVLGGKAWPDQARAQSELLRSLRDPGPPLARGMVARYTWTAEDPPRHLYRADVGEGRASIHQRSLASAWKTLADGVRIGSAQRELEVRFWSSLCSRPVSDVGICPGGLSVYRDSAGQMRLFDGETGRDVAVGVETGGEAGTWLSPLTPPAPDALLALQSARNTHSLWVYRRASGALERIDAPPGFVHDAVPAAGGHVVEAGEAHDLWLVAPGRPPRRIWPSP
jgi:hypothetical protein